jgi:hypothetical protein
MNPARDRFRLASWARASDDDGDVQHESVSFS